MDKSAFLEELANILDEESVEETANLRDYQSWDSLAVLSIISLATSKFGFILSFPEVRGLTTVADLWAHFAQESTMWRI